MDVLPKAMLEPNTILIVEDEILIRLELADYLRDCGYRVLEAANADEAIAVLQTDQQVDLIFSDDRCPVRLMDLASRLGREQADQNIKVILTSGVAHSAELAQDICEDGAIEAKPYHPQLLVKRIKKALAQVSRAGNEPLPSAELVASSADSPVRDMLMGFPLEACSTTPAEATKKLRL